MATTNITPSPDARINIGAGFSCEITAVGASEVTVSASDGVTANTLWTLTGGFEAGYEGTASTLTGVTTLSNVQPTAGWWGSPTVITVTDTISGTATSQSWTYYVSGIAQYPPGTKPYNEEYATGDGVIVLDSGASQGVATSIDFNDNLTATVSSGVATVDGLAGGGGGSAITVTDEGGAPLTTNAASFDFVGGGVTATSVGDDVTVTVPGIGAASNGVYGTLQTDGVGGYTLVGAQGISSATLQLGEIRLDFEVSFGDDEFPVQVTPSPDSTQLFDSHNVVAYYKDTSGDYVMFRYFDESNSIVDPRNVAVGVDFLIGGLAGGEAGTGVGSSALGEWEYNADGTVAGQFTASDVDLSLATYFIAADDNFGGSDMSLPLGSLPDGANLFVRNTADPSRCAQYTLGAASDQAGYTTIPVTFVAETAGTGSASIGERWEFYVQAVVGAASSDHGGLTGLTDDDHVRYVDIAGTRSQAAALIESRADHVNAPATGFTELWSKANAVLDDPMWTDDSGTDWTIMRGSAMNDSEVPFWVTGANGNYLFTSSGFTYASGKLTLGSGTSDLTLVQRATGPTFAAGESMVWTKSDSPTTLWFTDDTGGEHQLGVGSGGDVTGPGPTVTDNAVTRFDGTGGLTIQESPVIIDDSGNISGVVDITAETLTGGSGTDFTEFNGTGIIPYAANVSTWTIGGVVDSTGSPIDISLLGTKSGTTAVAGGALNVFGGNATVGTADGGDLNLSGGAGVGGGVLGNVVVEGSEFQLGTVPLTTSSTIAGMDSDDFAAVTGAASPSAGNVFATMADVGAGGGGTVTSVSITGTDGIEVDSGSPITTAGTIVLGSDKLLGIEALADVTDATNVAAAGALMLTGGAMTGPITTNSTIAGMDSDDFDAVTGAASPSSTNVFATMDDVGAAGGGDVTAAATLTEDYLVSGDTPTKGVKASSLTTAEVVTAVAVTQDVTTNPHSTSLGNLVAGTHNQLELASVDSGKIIASGQTGQINSLTVKGTPVVGDMVLIEDSAAGFAKKRAAWPTTAAEVNNLETSTDGIAANEIAVGTGTDVSTYTPVAASTVVGRGAAGNIVAAQLETSQITDGAVTYAKMQQVATDNKLLGYIGTAPGTVEEVSVATVNGLLPLFATDGTEKGICPGSDSLGATYYLDGSGAWSIPAGGGGGDVTGPGPTVTDNAVARFDGTGGLTIQESPVVIADTTGDITGAGTYNTITIKDWEVSSGTIHTDNYIEGGPGTDTDAVHGNVANQFDTGATPSIASKAGPLGADRILIEDSEAAGAKKYALLSNLPVVPGDVETLYSTALKASAGTITKGQVVYTVGWNIGNSCVTVELADASSAATMPGLGVAAETITNVATGLVVVDGELLNSGVAGLTTGDAVYVSETTGGLTATKPTGTALIQKMGTCIRHTGEVNIQVSGAGRSNDVPNIAENNLWLGNASGVATATSRAGIDTDAIHTADTITAAQHGSQTDETLHAIVVAGATDGFMTAEMATTLAATDAAGTARPPTSHAYDSHTGAVPAADLPAATTSVQGAVILSTDGESTPGEVVQADDARLSDDRTPSSHAYDSHTGTVPIADIAGTPTGTGDLVLETSPTIVTPTIANFTNATHDHADAAGGGTIAYADITGTPSPKPDSVYIEAPVSGDVINIGRADRTQTISAVHAVLDDGTSVVVSFDSGASRATSDQQHVNAQTCSSTTTGTDLTKTANLTFDSGDWRWFTIGTVTGATGMTITVSYT